MSGDLKFPVMNCISHIRKHGSQHEIVEENKIEGVREEEILLLFERETEISEVLGKTRCWCQMSMIESNSTMVGL